MIGMKLYWKSHNGGGGEGNYTGDLVSGGGGGRGKGSLACYEYQEEWQTRNTYMYIFFIFVNRPQETRHTKLLITKSVIVQCFGKV